MSESAAPAGADHVPPHERLHALDAVRGFALLLGIVFHAAASFLVAPQQVWLVTDTDPSTALTVFFYVAHMFRMATFFVIGGFFAHLLFHRRGEHDFVRDRLRRIGLPLLVGWPVLAPALFGCLIWGAWVMHDGKLPPPPPPDPNAPPLAFPLTHLWFLYVLIWFYALTLLIRRLVARLDPRGRARARLDLLVRAIVRSPWGVVALAAPTCAALFALPLWRPWFGIPTPDMSLLPNVAAFVAFGSAFGFGWLLHRQTELLAVLQARWPWHLAIAVLATIGSLAHVGVTASIEFASHDMATFGYAAGYALATWSWSLALIGVALRYLAGYSARRRYLADASYWLYLIHLPIVIALQIVVSQLSWPAWAKFVAILAVAFPVMLLSYRYWVRGTFIGAVLNGRRYPRLPGADEPHMVANVESSS
jgi:peptidoglycan/LPS O-acetylase OafA/YrhL